MNKNELVEQLDESHQRFVTAIINNDGELAILAYRNYVLALSQVIDMVMRMDAGQQGKKG